MGTGLAAAVFGVIATGAAAIAKVLFFLFLIAFVVSLGMLVFNGVVSLCGRFRRAPTVDSIALLRRARCEKHGSRRLDPLAQPRARPVGRVLHARLPMRLDF